ncbi:hypothetical protein R1A27_08580 [Methylobacterium sp. NMS12]|uniref:hypothetical protein n=1 Tax=Methylobacterium sp. NMS12 TaxID=3079766 RepID=UPI003F8840BC
MQHHVQAPQPGSPVTADHAPRPLRRWEVSAYVKDRFGIDIAPSTLAKLASIGGGPPFYKNARAPLYPVDLLDEWALARRGNVVRSTSEVA